MIELRSDTFTLPTPKMRAAIASASVGNDVYGEDPTVRRLERTFADMLDVEASCLMPSGTMANLAAIMAHVPRGSKLLVGDESDIYRHEAGGASVCAGAVYEPVRTQADGRLAVADLAAGFPTDPADPEFAPTALICVENTHNRRGGRVLPPSYLAEVAALARARGVPVHLDGARLFNAAAALDLPVARLAEHADSVQCCLSKGLGAPVGSMLAGRSEFIDRARRIRKMLGGGMRQAGIIAAAGLLALDTATERVGADHANARLLAAGLREVTGLAVDPTVETNILMFSPTDPGWTLGAFIDALSAQGVAVTELVTGKVRAVTHSGVTEVDVRRAVEVVARVMRTGPVAVNGRPIGTYA